MNISSLSLPRLSPPLLSASVSLRVLCGRSRPRPHPQTATSSPKVATSPCHFLPLLPPITPNVKLPIPANRLEFSGQPHPPHESFSKSGKNGNVDHPSQHCHPIAPSSRRHVLSPYGPFPAREGGRGLGR